jgi:hypothetical protein
VIQREKDFTDYRQYYDLESYLFETVTEKFNQQGYLDAFDFFCIVIWKANRAKSKIARRILDCAKTKDLEGAVRTLTSGLKKLAPKERLLYLLDNWKLRLPMASAILTVLDPTEFTVYDWRTCSQLGLDDDIANLSDSKEIWSKYQEFKSRVEQKTLAEMPLSLREKDRFLWGKSFHDQLVADIKRSFGIDPSSTTEHEEPASNG